MKGGVVEKREKPDLLSQWKRAVESLSLIQVEGWSSSTRINSPVTSQANHERPLSRDRNGYRAEGTHRHTSANLLSTQQCPVLFHQWHKSTCMGQSTNPCNHDHTEQHHEIQRFHMFSAQTVFGISVLIRSFLSSPALVDPQVNTTGKR